MTPLKSQSGMTLVEMLVTMAVFSVFSVFALEIVLNGQAIGQGTVARHNADSVAGHARNLFMLRWEQRADARPGAKGGFEISRKTLSGDVEWVRFGTACRPVPKELRVKNLPLHTLMEAQSEASRGSLCSRKQAAGPLLCPPDHRPVLVVERMRTRPGPGGKETLVGKVQSFEHPNAASIGRSAAIAGGFCIVPINASEMRAVFTQIVYENNRFIYREADLALLGPLGSLKFLADTRPEK